MKLWLSITIAIVGTMWLTILAPQPWCPAPIAILGRAGFLILPIFGMLAIGVLWHQYKLAAFTPLAVFIVGIFLADKHMPSSARLSLPSSATNVQEYYEDFGITGDFTRLLKAEMSESDYHAYARSLGFTQQFDPVSDDDISSVIEFGGASGPSWWDPPSASSSTYFAHERGDEYIRTLRYDRGTAYLIIVSW